ncbi:MAG: PhnD/SsuA/transferrin family substrate-binding protein, partial [Symploca sp. SIO1C4]|nr:PhnD/SsuA/transferrin family substrate-binding protein [Symploca sp. SIO1C4]
LPYAEREVALQNGRIEIGWICGLLYVLLNQKQPHTLDLLAAPVLDYNRYANSPVYFSDLIVRTDSPFQSFIALRGARLAYNEATSFSGYRILLAHLADQGETAAFFPQPLQTGAHSHSITAVLQGHADVAAIDSTAYDELPHTLKSQLRILMTLGPNPVPPFVISSKVAPTLRQKITDTLLNLPACPHGQTLLRQSHLRRFAPVTDADYDQIRHVNQQALTLLAG